MLLVLLFLSRAFYSLFYKRERIECLCFVNPAIEAFPTEGIIWNEMVSQYGMTGF